MSQIFGFNKDVVFGSALAVSTGAALYSYYKLRLRNKEDSKDNVYESEKLLHEYLVFHYGQPREVLRYDFGIDFGPQDALDFPKRCADLCMQHFNQDKCKVNRALDIGCAVGRSSFELARKFEKVVGIDYSHSFVKACQSLKDSGSMDYYVYDEGDLVTNLKASIDPSIDRSRTAFMQADACNLPMQLGQFGCVLAANLICRLQTPHDFLNRMSSMIAPGGILVITSPYTFLREFTPRRNWLGGFKNETGEVVTGFDTLKKVLGENFDLLEDRNMPFFIRETARKNQWTVAHATVWQKR